MGKPIVLDNPIIQCASDETDAQRQARHKRLSEDLMNALIEDEAFENEKMDRILYDFDPEY